MDWLPSCTFVVQIYAHKHPSAMYDSFLGFINEHRLIEPTDRVLLAVSGGIDSMVMANLFARTGFPFGIAHVNFSLRGAESDADEELVRALATQLNAPFHTTRFDTHAIADERGWSIQVLARDLRYDWFRAVAHEHGYTRIATAHHQNDVLETLLLNLIRGTGLTGLRSIPVRQGAIIRPMWALSRLQIKDYAVDQGVLWRNDRSNDDDKYSRNKLRHHVVPVMEKLNPNLLNTLTHTLERLRAADSLVTGLLTHSWETCIKRDGIFQTIDTKTLTTLPEWPFQLSEWLKPFEFSYVQSLDIARVVSSAKTGQVFRSTTHGVWHDRTGLIIAPLVVETPFELSLSSAPENGLVTLPDGRQFSYRTYDQPADFQLLTDPAIAQLDADQLPGPLTLRRWQEGDRFRPLNMPGHKLVSDLLNDRKVSLPERCRTAVLMAGAEIGWVVGHRLAHGARVTEQTQRILECRLEG